MPMDIQEDQIPPEDSQTPPTDSSTQNQIPPTDRPQGRVIDPAEYDMMMATMREQNRRLQELSTQVERSVNTPPPAPPKTPDEMRAEFYDNPVIATRNIVNDALEKTVMPLKEEISSFLREYRGGNRVDQLLARARQNPRYDKHWGPKLEGYLRSQLTNVDASQISDQAFDFLVVSAIGLKTTGQLIEDETSGPPMPNNPTPAPRNQNSPPPYMPPSSPAGPARPTGDPNEANPPLTEEEKRILREYNATKPDAKKMTPRQYREWQGVNARDVATSNIGRPSGNGR